MTSSTQRNSGEEFASGVTVPALTNAHDRERLLPRVCSGAVRMAGPRLCDIFAFVAAATVG